MITDVKVGDRVWLVWSWRIYEAEVVSVGFSETQINVRIYDYTYDNVYLDHCFPSLESLLQHLKETAIYYKETNEA